MKIKSNAHTHTTFCDGQNTAEQMVEKAIALDFTAIGFTGHSMSFGCEAFALNDETMPLYVAEINRLKEKYKDIISVYLSVEIDSLTETPLPDLDYKLGSAHTVIGKNGFYCKVDCSLADFKEGVEKGFDGDVFAFIKAYYDAVSEMLDRIKPDICGHFDLVRKFNYGNVLFDESCDEYKNIVKPVLKKHADKVIFELNTNCVYKKLRTMPYPDTWVLGELFKNGSKIMINSDSHAAESLNFHFAETVEIIKKIGFTKVSVLGKNGIEEIEI